MKYANCSTSIFLCIKKEQKCIVFVPRKIQLSSFQMHFTRIPFVSTTKCTFWFDRQIDRASLMSFEIAGVSVVSELLTGCAKEYKEC